MRLIDLREHLKLRRTDRSYSVDSLNRFINGAYLDIGSRRNWGWLKRVHRWNTTPAASYASDGLNTQWTTVKGSGGMNIAVGAATLQYVSFARRRLLINGRVYRVIGYTPSSDPAPNSKPQGSDILFEPLAADTFGYIPPLFPPGSLTVLYDEIALPRSTDTVLGVKLITGGSPLDLDAVEPWQFQDRTRSSLGQPTAFSAVRKEPLPVPVPAPPVPTTPAAAPNGPDAGAYMYRFSFWDEVSGAESALGPALTHTAPGGQALQFSFNGTVFPFDAHMRDGKYGVRLYRTKVAPPTTALENDYFFVGQADHLQNTVVDRLRDVELGARAEESGSTLFLNLYPAPNALYEIEVLYQTEVESLHNDDDRTLFDATYSNVLLDGAEALMLEASDEFRGAQLVRQRFEMGVARMMQRDRLSLATLAPVATRSGNRIRARRFAERWEYP